MSLVRALIVANLQVGWCTLVRTSALQPRKVGHPIESEIKSEIESDETDTPNYRGVLTWGSCLVPKPNVDGIYGTGQFSQCQCCPSSIQCVADYLSHKQWQPIPNESGSCQFSSCQQNYAFPYYYYDKFIGRALYQTEHAPSTVLPPQLESTAMAAAQEICDEVMTNMNKYKWAGPAAKLANVTTLAWIWLSANQANPKVQRDCAAALVIVFGECQDQDLNGLLACQVDVYSDPWQTGSTAGPLVSAKKVYEDRCNDTKAIVPDGAVSSGNKNYLDAWTGTAWVAGTTFCHHNQWSGAAFGGGMCAGGLVGHPIETGETRPTPPPTPPPTPTTTRRRRSSRGPTRRR